MNIQLVPVNDVDTGDILANGDTVTDSYYSENGDYNLELEKWMIDGSTQLYNVSYPVSAFIRIKTFC